MHIATLAETVDSWFIPGRVKPKAIKIGIRCFPAWLTARKETLWSIHCVWWAGGQKAAWLEDRKVPSLSPGQGNVMKRNVITIAKRYFVPIHFGCFIHTLLHHNQLIITIYSDARRKFSHSTHTSCITSCFCTSDFLSTSPELSSSLKLCFRLRMLTQNLRNVSCTTWRHWS